MVGRDYDQMLFFVWAMGWKSNRPKQQKGEESCKCLGLAKYWGVDIAKLVERKCSK